MRPSTAVLAAERALSALLALALMPVLALSLMYVSEEKRIADGGFLSGEIMERKPAVGTTEGNPDGTGPAGSSSGETGGAKPLSALREINPDICAWLTVDGTHIDYPVVRGSDDSYYLSRSYEGEESVSGAIFLSCGNSADFTDHYSLIYGHHMDNGAMFGDVVRFLEEEFFAGHPGGTLYTGKGVRRIRFFACVRTVEDDSVIYSLSSSAPELTARADDLPGVHFPAGPEGEGGIVALSTCYGARAEERAVLLGTVGRAIPWEEYGSAAEEEEGR